MSVLHLQVFSAWAKPRNKAVEVPWPSPTPTSAPVTDPETGGKGWSRCLTCVWHVGTGNRCVLVRMPWNPSRQGCRDLGVSTSLATRAFILLWLSFSSVKVDDSNPKVLGWWTSYVAHGRSWLVMKPSLLTSVRNRAIIFLNWPSLLLKTVCFLASLPVVQNIISLIMRNVLLTSSLNLIIAALYPTVLEPMWSLDRTTLFPLEMYIESNPILFALHLVGKTRQSLSVTQDPLFLSCYNNEGNTITLENITQWLLQMLLVST